MKKFQKKTFLSKNKEKEPEGLKTSSPMPKAPPMAERYIEEIEPQQKKEFVTYRQTTDVWDGKRWVTVSIRFGDVASRNITRDVRKIIEENRPLKKVIHKEEPNKVEVPE